MIDRTTRLRWRRLFRRQYRQMESMSVQAEENLERHFFKRLGHLTRVRRFVISWVLLLVLLVSGAVAQLRGLGQYYQVVAPAPGGTFTEGTVGMFTNANPLYATGAADSAVSRLVFSGLMRYDQKNRLVGDLAEKIDVDERGVAYTVTLRRKLRWQDGKPLTTADVLYTYQTIQNPDARSPLFSSWQGVKLEVRDERTIVFTLPGALGAFTHSLTNGIVPKHVLENTPPSQLRTARFNTVSPVGSGPFKWKTIEVTGTSQEEREERVGLVPNEYFYRDPAKLQQVVIRTFRDEKHMIKAYEQGELNSMVGLSSVPDNLRSSAEIREYNIPLTGAVMVFFKTTQEPLSNIKVRQGLVRAVDVPGIVNGFGYPVIVTHGPLLTSQVGYDKQLIQLPFEQTAANILLDESGYRRGSSGMREKDGKPLTFRLYAQNSSEYATVTAGLQKAWQAVGVATEVVLQSDSDMQGVVSRHDYDAVLYGISLGTDPDVFPYWHSSQADPRSVNRLNLSEYRSTAVDKALEAGRTRSDAAVRAFKYRPFLETWRVDAPALSMYQPRFLYVTRGEVFNFEPRTLNSITDRFSNVENWMIRKEKATK